MKNNIIVNATANKYVKKVSIVDSGDDLSDHKPIDGLLKIDMSSKFTNVEVVENKKIFHKFDWIFY